MAVVYILVLNLVHHLVILTDMEMLVKLKRYDYKIAAIILSPYYPSLPPFPPLFLSPFPLTISLPLSPSLPLLFPSLPFSLSLSTE